MNNKRSIAIAFGLVAALGLAGLLLQQRAEGQAPAANVEPAA